MNYEYILPEQEIFKYTSSMTTYIGLSSPITFLLILFLHRPYRKYQASPPIDIFLFVWSATVPAKI